MQGSINSVVSVLASLDMNRNYIITVITKYMVHMRVSSES